MLFGRVSGAPGGPMTVGSRPGARGLPQAPVRGPTGADAGAQPLDLCTRRVGVVSPRIAAGISRSIASGQAASATAPSPPSAARLRSDGSCAGPRSGRLAGRAVASQTTPEAVGRGSVAARASGASRPHGLGLVESSSLLGGVRAVCSQRPSLGSSSSPAGGRGRPLDVVAAFRRGRRLSSLSPSVVRSSAPGEIPELEPAALVLTMPRRDPEEGEGAPSAAALAEAEAEAADDEDSLSPLSPLAPFPSSSDPSSRRVPAIFGVSFQDVYYWLNCAYWGAVLLAVALGHETLTGVLSFPLYTLAMCLASAGFAAYYGGRAFAGAHREARNRVASERHAERQGEVSSTGRSEDPSVPLSRASSLPRRAALRAFARYGWNALFWSGFVIWAVVPPSAQAADLLGPPAVVAAAYGGLLAVASFAVSGSYTFLGGPKVPAKLITAGPHALLRHPQTLGNFLFLVGFALAGGAVWAALVFALSLWLYLVAVVPDQRAAMEHKFGEPFRAYARRVPAFRNGLIGLVLVELVALWRMAPWEGLAAPR